MEFTQKSLKLKSNLDELRPIDKEKEAIIMQKLRLDWNYHSNHLEGNSLTFGETKALILFGITAQGKPLKDHIEVTGHDEAIKWITEIVQSERPISENFIRELHVLLLKEPYEVDAITPDGQPTKRKIEVGKYKSVPNHVLTKTGEIFRFASVEETPAKMNDLIEWYREKVENTEVNPIFLAAEFHYKFIRIHPFDDGNGRVARILMNFILMKYGFPPVIIKTEDKQNYFSALQLADSGQIEPFIEYIAQNLCRSLTLMIAGAKGENIEEDDDLDKEIALLEQRMKAASSNFSNTQYITKTSEAVLNIYDNSLIILFNKIAEVSKKFSYFYRLNITKLRINRYELNQPLHFDLTEARNDIDSKIISIEFSSQSSNFKNTISENHRFSIMIEVLFHLYNYTINLPFLKKTFQKLYSEQLTDSEIKEIINSETQRHKAFIEDKIKEIENKKSSQN